MDTRGDLPRKYYGRGRACPTASGPRQFVPSVLPEKKSSADTAKMALTNHQIIATRIACAEVAALTTVMARLGPREDFSLHSDEPEVGTADSVDLPAFAAEGGRRIRVEGLGVTLYSDSELVEFRTLHAEGDIGSLDAATVEGERLVTAALVSSGVSAERIWFQGGLTPIVARFAQDDCPLGWRLRRRTHGPSGVFARVQGQWFATDWMIALGLGDPRCSLGAFRDGRVYLRFPRSLLPGLSWHYQGPEPAM